MKVKRVATGLLLVMALLYIVARSYEGAHASMHWLRAFAEAGMIGALADWFAVVALFRHPLGVRIPHTAIVVQKQAAIGRSLARLVREQFMTVEVIKHQLQEAEVLRRALMWLRSEENSRQVLGMIGAHLPAVRLEEEARQRVARSVCMELSEAPVERGIGRWIEQAVKSSEFRGVVGPLFGKLSEAVQEQRGWVEQEVSERGTTGRSRLIKRLTKGVTAAVSGHFVKQLAEQLEEASVDQEHPLYARLESSLIALGEEMQQGEGEWAEWRKEVMMHESVQEGAVTCLVSGERYLTEHGEEIERMGAEMLRNYAEKVIASPEAYQALEVKIMEWVERGTDRYGEVVEQMINRRVSQWDAHEMARQLERTVGADLQYIRISGSLVAGMIGLLLHALGLLLWGQ